VIYVTADEGLEAFSRKPTLKDTADLVIVEHQETLGRLRPIVHPRAARNVA
jgi:hypothetical protein